MTMADMSNGPTWPGYLVVILLFLLAAVLLSGRGSWLIAGYNTASKEKKEKYDEKKLCRVTGGGLAVIAGLILAVLLLETKLPAAFAPVLGGLIVAICAGIILLANTVCKK